MKSLRNTLKRIKSKKDVETKESAGKEQKKRPPFKPRPEMIIAYTHDSIKEGLTKIEKSRDELTPEKLSAIYREMDKLHDVVRIHRAQETNKYFPMVKDSDKVEDAKSAIESLIHEHEDDEKQYQSLRSDIKVAYVQYKQEKKKKSKEGEDKQGEEQGEGEDKKKTKDAETKKSKNSLDVKVDALKEKFTEFITNQREHLTHEEELYQKAVPEIFTPADVSAPNMKNILDNNREDFEKTLLPYITAFIIGTGRSGKLRQLIDSVQRASSVDDFKKYRKFFKTVVDDHLWGKLCKLGYDKDLEAEKPKEKEAASPKETKKPAENKSSGRQSVRGKLHKGDTVAVKDTLTGERRTGEVLEIIEGGNRIVLKVKKESDSHPEPLELIYYVKKSLCRKVVTLEEFKRLESVTKKINEEAEEEKKEEAPKTKKEEAPKQKKEEAPKEKAAEPKKEAKKEEKPKVEEKPKKAEEKPKKEEEKPKKEEEKPKKEEEKPKKEEEKPKAAAEEPVEEKKESEPAVEETPVDPASGPFALIVLTNEALRLALDGLTTRVKDLKADDKDGVSAFAKDFEAYIACVAGRFALEDDTFVSTYVARNKVGDLKDERKFDGTERKAIAELLGKLSDDNVKSLIDRFGEWAGDHRAGIQREEKLLLTGSPDAEDVIYSLKESVKRERDAFDKSVEPFVAGKLEGDQLKSWQAAVKAVTA